MSSPLSRVLITGGTRGIGFATAEHFAARGSEVLLNYHRDDVQAEQARAALTSSDAVARVLRADVGDAASVDQMFDTLDGLELNVLIVNAAATAFKPLLETGRHNLGKTFDITVSGFVHLVQRAVAVMPDGSSIVAVSGFDAIRALELHGTLGAAKAAMETLVRYFAVELASRNIRVNGVSPGFIDTKSAQIYADKAGHDSPQSEWARQPPLGRLGTSAEVAAVIGFLASSEASYVTGQTLVVDGGLTLR